MDVILCTPAIVFLIITLIMVCIIVLTKLNKKDLSNFFSWLSVSIVLTFVINVMCNNSSTVITWIIAGLFIVSALLLFVMTVSK